MEMKLTREQALFYHRQMWSDMQQKLGDDAYGIDRVNYKEDWCYEHFPNEHIKNDCFLCEYANNEDNITNCQKCPIRWATENNGDAVTSFCCYDGYYYNTPISEILALPERELRKEN